MSIRYLREVKKADKSEEVSLNKKFTGSLIDLQRVGDIKTRIRPVTLSLSASTDKGPAGQVQSFQVQIVWNDSWGKYFETRQPTQDEAIKVYEALEAKIKESDIEIGKLDYNKAEEVSQSIEGIIQGLKAPTTAGFKVLESLAIGDIVLNRNKPKLVVKDSTFDIGTKVSNLDVTTPCSFKTFISPSSSFLNDNVDIFYWDGVITKGANNTEVYKEGVVRVRVLGKQLWYEGVKKADYDNLVKNLLKQPGEYGWVYSSISKQWEKKASAPVEVSLPILQDLMSQGYDTATFLALGGACEICTSHDGETKALQDVITDAQFDAPIYTWAHPGCKDIMVITGNGMSEVHVGALGIVTANLKKGTIPNMESSEDAIEYGKKIKGNKEAIQELKDERAKLKTEFDTLLAKDDHKSMQLASTVSTKMQLMREAYETAEGIEISPSAKLEVKAEGGVIQNIFFDNDKSMTDYLEKQKFQGKQPEVKDKSGKPEVKKPTPATEVKPKDSESKPEGEEKKTLPPLEAPVAGPGAIPSGTSLKVKSDYDLEPNKEDIDKAWLGLDPLEKQSFDGFMKTNNDTMKALEMIYNSVEGDISQLSIAMQEFAKKYFANDIKRWESGENSREGKLNTKSEEKPKEDGGIRRYGPGKFDTIVDEVVYSMSLDGGPDEEVGDVSTTNWYGLMKNMTVEQAESTAEEIGESPLTEEEKEWFKDNPCAIIEANEQGFVTVDGFASEEEAKPDWNRIVDEVTKLEEEGEDVGGKLNRKSDRTDNPEGDPTFECPSCETIFTGDKWSNERRNIEDNKYTPCPICRFKGKFIDKGRTKLSPDRARILPAKKSAKVVKVWMTWKMTDIEKNHNLPPSTYVTDSIAQDRAKLIDLISNEFGAVPETVEVDKDFKVKKSYWSVFDKETGNYLATGGNSDTLEEAVEDCFEYLQSDSDESASKDMSIEDKQGYCEENGFRFEEHKEKMSEGSLKVKSSSIESIEKNLARAKEQRKYFIEKLQEKGNTPDQKVKFQKGKDKWEKEIDRYDRQLSQALSEERRLEKEDKAKEKAEAEAKAAEEAKKAEPKPAEVKESAQDDGRIIYTPVSVGDEVVLTYQRGSSGETWGEGRGVVVDTDGKRFNIEMIDDKDKFGEPKGTTIELYREEFLTPEEYRKASGSDVTIEFKEGSGDSGRGQGGPGRGGRPRTDKERLIRHKRRFPKDKVKTEKDLPPRGTGRGVVPMAEFGLGAGVSSGGDITYKKSQKESENRKLTGDITVSGENSDVSGDITIPAGETITMVEEYHDFWVLSWKGLDYAADKGDIDLKTEKVASLEAKAYKVGEKVVAKETIRYKRIDMPKDKECAIWKGEMCTVTRLDAKGNLFFEGIPEESGAFDKDMFDFGCQDKCEEGACTCGCGASLKDLPESGMGYVKCPKCGKLNVNAKLKVKAEGGEKVRCNKCDWEGVEEDLEMVEEVVDGKSEFIKACPKCKTDHYLMDVEGKLEKAQSEIIAKHCNASVVMDLGKKAGEGKKLYNITENVGKSKYVVSFHDGVKKHEDGSDFYDVKIFNNKKDMKEFEDGLLKDGYTYGSALSNEGRLGKKASDFSNEPKAREIVDKMFPTDNIMESDGTNEEGFIYELENHPNWIKVNPDWTVIEIDPQTGEILKELSPKGGLGKKASVDKSEPKKGSSENKEFKPLSADELKTKYNVETKYQNGLVAVSRSYPGLLVPIAQFVMTKIVNEKAPMFASALNNFGKVIDLAEIQTGAESLELAIHNLTAFYGDHIINGTVVDSWDPCFNVSAYFKTREESVAWLDDLELRMKTDNQFRGKSLYVKDGHFIFRNIPKVLFEDVILDQAIKDDIFLNTVGFLSDEKMRTIGVNRRGLLMYGLPGTGKTSICKAIFAELEGKGVSRIYVTPESFGRMSVGTLFDLLPYLGKTVLCMEDVDAMGLSREIMAAGTLLGDLLTNLDGMRKLSDPFVLIASTNCVGHLDPALSRPGRMDRRIKFELPSDEHLKKIYFKLIGEEVGDDVIKLSQRFTGAHCGEVVNTARILASSTNKKVGECMIEAATLIQANFFPDESFIQELSKGYK